MPTHLVKFHIRQVTLTETLDLSQSKPCLAMRQGGFLFRILEGGEARELTQI